MLFVNVKALGLNYCTLMCTCLTNYNTLQFQHSFYILYMIFVNYIQKLNLVHILFLFFSCFPCVQFITLELLMGNEVNIKEMV